MPPSNTPTFAIQCGQSNMPQHPTAFNSCNKKSLSLRINLLQLRTASHKQNPVIEKDESSQEKEFTKLLVLPALIDLERLHVVIGACQVCVYGHRQCRGCQPMSGHCYQSQPLLLWRFERQCAC